MVYVVVPAPGTFMCRGGVAVLMNRWAESDLQKTV